MEICRQRPFDYNMLTLWRIECNMESIALPKSLRRGWQENAKQVCRKCSALLPLRTVLSQLFVVFRHKFKALYLVEDDREPGELAKSKVWKDPLGQSDTRVTVALNGFGSASERDFMQAMAANMGLTTFFGYLSKNCA